MKKLILACLLIASSSYADRSVSIAVSDGKLELTNGSAVTVTYTAECYDKVTGTNLLTGASAVTLNSKKSVTYMSAGMCANDIASVFKSSAGPFACAGSVNFSNAASLCGPQSTLCTLAALNTATVSSLQGFPNYYWLDAGQTNWYSTWDNWGKNSALTQTGGGKNYAPRTYSDSKGNANSRCSTSASGGVGYCTNQDVTYNSSGSICCPVNNGFKSCKVTIHSATPATGFLQSPQFKGGSSF